MSNLLNFYSALGDLGKSKLVNESPRDAPAEFFHLFSHSLCTFNAHPLNFSCHTACSCPVLYPKEISFYFFSIIKGEKKLKINSDVS